MSQGAFQDVPPCEARPCQKHSDKEQGGSSLRGDEKSPCPGAEPGGCLCGDSTPCPSSVDLDTKTPGAFQGRAFLTPLSYPWAGFWSILHQSFRRCFYSVRAAGRKNRSSNTGMNLPLQQPPANPGAPFAQREHWGGKSFHRAARAGLGPWPPSVGSESNTSRSQQASEACPASPPVLSQVSSPG